MPNARKASLPTSTAIGSPKETLTAICFVCITLSEENGILKECALSLACCVPRRQRHTGKIELRKMNWFSLHSSYYHLQDLPLTAYCVEKMTMRTAFLRILQHRVWLHTHTRQKRFNIKPKAWLLVWNKAVLWKLYTENSITSTPSCPWYWATIPLSFI